MKLIHLGDRPDIAYRLILFVTKIVLFFGQKSCLAVALTPNHAQHYKIVIAWKELKTFVGPIYLVWMYL